MRKREVIVVGAGPRGLSVALCALKEGLSVRIVDPSPLSTWVVPNALPDLRMRSPITFDLVTSLPPEYREWRLDTHMGVRAPYSDQWGIESSDVYIWRHAFLAYLQSCLGRLESTCEVIREAATSVTGTSVLTASGRLLEGHVVLCIGESSKPKLPLWLGRTKELERAISIRDVIESPPIDKEVGVLGSGQSAAEVVAHLAAHGNRVYWLRNKAYRVRQYPVPTTMEWGYKSALGDYYRTLSTDTQRLDYLQSVKAWQPSITPDIEAQLHEMRERVVSLEPTSLSDIPGSIPIVISTGPQTSIQSIRDICKLTPHPAIPRLPLLGEGFRSVEGVYITGLLALFYDGPRQGSVISAGATAMEIVRSIRNEG